MLDILTIVHSFADIQTASRIRQTCRKLAALIPSPVIYTDSTYDKEYEYRVGNILHRLDGPAMKSVFGTEYWYRGGVTHREYHPECTSRYYKYYIVYDVTHREVGPSIISRDMCSWSSRGLLHRKIGPAYRCGNIVEWYTVNKLHRLDGPAYRDEYVIRGKSHRISGSMNDEWIVDDKFIR